MYKFICVCVLIVIALSGCSLNKNIEFNYQSKFDSAIKGLVPSEKKQMTKSKNIYIYHYDNSDMKQGNSNNIDFAPVNSKFDISY